MIKVAVLGCGPAGLLAAQGAAEAGAAVTIYSKKAKSPIFGAQFIHEQIPRMNVKPSDVHIFKRGSAEGYAKKVYGDPEHETSFDSYDHGQILPAWPMIGVYNKLWSIWRNSIVEQEIDMLAMNAIEAMDYDMLISSIPVPAICMKGGHTFETNTVYISKGQCESNRNSVIYNGEAKTAWFRTSFLFGETGVEFSSHIATTARGKAVPQGRKEIKKPQSTTCDCRDQCRRVGRYGKWQRGVLAHSAYFEVRDALLRV